MSPVRDHAHPLSAAADDLAERHRSHKFVSPAAPIEALTRIDALTPWLGLALTAAGQADSKAATAAEWLLDNDFQIRRAALQIAEDLPQGFYRRLPGLEGEPPGSPPRVYTVAHALLRATHLQVDLGSVIHFIDRYQGHSPLSIGELWALPTMLRIACIELLVGGFERLFPDIRQPFSSSGGAELSAATDPTECVSRGIANLGVIATIQWKDFFDATCRVETILRRDPANVYAAMDFETRDSYRRVIELLATRSDLTETAVAERLLDYCQGEEPLDHVGYWLVGDGRPHFEDAIQSRPFAVTALGRRLLRHRALLYAAALCAAGLAAFALPAVYLAMVRASPLSWWLGIGLSAFPASIISVTLVNWLVTLLVPPRVLPKLDFETGIAGDCPTAVVIPALVGRLGDVDGLLARLESHWLANDDRLLRFVLLTDLADAGVETLPADAEIESALIAGIEALNRRHGGAEEQGPFHLLHRKRHYNPSQRCWMGWERKRGKLEQFNHFILTGDRDAFPIEAGDKDRLRPIRFVVTADTDTQLPPGVVRRLVGTLAHPLNQARFDPASTRVRSGYTILQPRVEITPSAADSSPFTRFFGGDTTIDIYSRAVSDVYQDLFGTGIFVGKGIYDVAAFARSLEGRIPENVLLSHDLFEGLHGRAALVSDIIIFEGFPTGYLDHCRRWHRWVRGDWQLLPWLLPSVPGRGGGRLPNPLGWFDRLKIFDNLRRSLIPPSLVLLLLAGWTVLDGNPLIWTLLAVAAPSAALFTDLVTGVARGRRRGVLQGLRRRIGDHLGRWLLAIAFLINDAATALHAIGTTLWRLRARIYLLEWTSAADTAIHFAGRAPRWAAWRDMAISPLFALILGSILLSTASGRFSVAWPLLALWAAAPEIAIWIARPVVRPREALSEDDRRFLRMIARRTWLFFETFVRPEDNWLPPDNIQEAPDEAVAHRTSPTNIGLMLLAALTAWRLGYITLSDLAARLRNALDALDRLEHYRGHILNWYDTRTLEPLEPRYVSTVDSGNLAVSLVIVAEACREARGGGAVDRALWAGLDDGLALLTDALAVSDIDPEKRCRTRIASLYDGRAESVSDPIAWWAWLDDLAQTQLPALRADIRAALSQARHAPPDALAEVQIWIERVEHHVAAAQREIRSLQPWVPLLARPPRSAVATAARLAELLGGARSLAMPAEICTAATAIIDEGVGPRGSSELSDWLAEMKRALEDGPAMAATLMDRLEDIARRAAARAHDMDFAFVFNSSSRLFHIGYNVSSDRLDPHHYDLLASEARLASFFAIAKGDVPFDHWFYLGRPITKTGGALSLVSWNGSMFEYLMPNLFLRSDAGTLLGQSDRSAVDLQRAYGKAHAIPWGISESSYASMGPDRIYRYHAFGVPELGLRRGLEQDLVVAPYATALALTVRTGLAIDNLHALERMGTIGRFGFYEAIDFTPSRAGSDGVAPLVRSYMAHHHGMSLAAFGNALCDDLMVRWFHGDAHVRTIDMLLNERIPWELPPEIARRPLALPPDAVPTTIPSLHGWVPRDASDPQALHVIGNGRMALRWGPQGLRLSWRDHVLTSIGPGPWLTVREPATGLSWAATPGLTPETAGEVRHQAHLIELHRRHQGLSITTELATAHADDVEIRRITIVNDQDVARSIDLTAYADVVLAPEMDAARHPAFSKMFIGSEALPTHRGIAFWRRPREAHDQAPVMIHHVIADDGEVQDFSLETDRAAFLGRNRDILDPAANIVQRLGGTAGWTLDPAAALRVALDIPAHGRRQCAFVTVAAGSRETAMEIAERYATLASLDWALSDAAAHAARAMHAIGLRPDQLPIAQALLARIVSPGKGKACEVSPDASRQILWALGISGDVPILLLRLGDAQQVDKLRMLLAAHRSWAHRGVPIDLVLTHEGAVGYVEPVRERIFDILRERRAQDLVGVRGGVHLIAVGQNDAERLATLEQAARLVLAEARDPVELQLARSTRPAARSPRFEPVDAPQPVVPLQTPPRDDKPLLLRNGLGGFDPGDATYVIDLEAGGTTPAPWSNILANESFGTLVTEAGLGFSWAINSGENRLTPWRNDPVRDPAPEILYLRDEETARIWTTTPQPAGPDTPCRIRHGIGTTQWERTSDGLVQTVQAFVPIEDPVKVVRLTLRNLLPRPRRITATYYARWLLGAVDGEPGDLRHAVYDTEAKALFASNPWHEPFTGRIGFLAANAAPHSLTVSNADFLGPGQAERRPEGLTNWDLGGCQEAFGDDCCAAYQVHIDLAVGEVAEVVFVLGEGSDRAEAVALLQRWRDPARVAQARTDVLTDWDRRLGAVTVSTPDPGFDLLVNRWMPYQTISARLRARAGFYQAGGAFGFRDQLQDVLALLHSDPAAARRHILVAAAHQFEEGDVLHWWHPPSGAGVRTRCSDDLLWLPFVVAHYVGATGDKDILAEPIAFLRAPLLSADEGDRYARFEAGEDRWTLFDHCQRALDRSDRLGAHGLPLIGAGDWNDGMNRIGAGGRGESVWLAWFQIATIESFAPLCALVGRGDLVGSLSARSQRLAMAVEAAGWDGTWYRRAFDDDGRPWGTSTDEDCRIDSISQSWAALSKRADPQRAEEALAAAKKLLLRPDDGLVRLLWPPFDKTPRDPGYIKAYPPGIRENGGQYTHAAAWLGMAFARCGDGVAAYEVFNRISPIRQTASEADLQRFRTEPYVLAADVGGSAPQLGRGGWSWYTGAAAWTWRLAVEEMIGITLVEGKVRVRPCLPPSWPSCEIRLARGNGRLHIRLENPLGLSTGRLTHRVDGADADLGDIAFPQDGSTLEIVARLGPIAASTLPPPAVSSVAG